MVKIGFFSFFTLEMKENFQPDSFNVFVLILTHEMSMVFFALSSVYYCVFLISRNNVHIDTLPSFEMGHS